MTASVEALFPRTSATLPRPERSDRFVPLRAGIRNVWEYDDQQFWLAGGRLLLRGQNTAGKSKALELLLPFVLDGETRPERLDPFGSRSKTMYWNLIEYDDARSSAIGYCWVEFGRLDPLDGRPLVVTVIVGMRATRSAGRKVETWFAVTPARIDDGLDLAPGGTPLTADRLRDALPEGSRFTTSARDHRAAVDHALFGLGVERYEALIHLLLQLRRPKLSEKLDTAKLADYLTDALPPLARSRMELLATAFARLDDETAAVEQLEGAVGELHGFLRHYRDLARIETRRRADEVRQSASRLDAVVADERAHRTAAEDAIARLAAIEAEVGEQETALAQARGALDGLDTGKVEALLQVERRADDAEHHAAIASKRAEDDQGAADRTRTELAAVEQRVAQATEAVHAFSRQTTVAATDAGLAELFAAHQPEASSDPDRAAVAWRHAAKRREEQLDRVDEASRSRDSAERVLAERSDQLALADDDAVRAQRDLDLAEEARDHELGELHVAVVAWAEAASDLGVDADAELGGPRACADASIEQLTTGTAIDVAAWLRPARERHVHRRSELAVQIEAADRDVADLERQRDDIAAARDDAPPPAPGRPAHRLDGGVPLWACVDFAPELSPDDCARVEAALHAGGWLDALVLASGVVTADARDTWFVPDRDGDQTRDEHGRPDDHEFGDRGGDHRRRFEASRLLVPSADGPLPSEAVEAALRSIGPIELDGGWQSIGIAGRWEKPAAEFIGAASRAAARARRVAELTTRIDDAAAHRRLLADELAAADAGIARLDAHHAAFPHVGRAREAITTVERCGATLLDRLARRDAAESGVLAQRQVVERTRLDLHHAETEAGCPAGSVAAARTALREYRTLIEQLRAALVRVIEVGQQLTATRQRADEADERATASSSAAADASRSAAAARAEATELRRTSGAEVDEIMSRQRELKAQVDACEASLRQLRNDSARVVGDRERAQALIEQTVGRRAEAEQARSRALERQARLTGTELPALALDVVAAERDLGQITAGLAFARTAAERLREVDASDAARDASRNRVYQSFTSLRARLVDFDPVLDGSDEMVQCMATSNGASIGIVQLTAVLDAEVTRRRTALTEEEKQLIERHLLSEVGAHIGEQVHAAWSLVDEMNRQLASHPTRSGVSLRLDWRADVDADDDVLRLLRRDVALLHHEERSRLAAFLHDRVRRAREDAEGADVVERLTAALDYRRWHRFRIRRISGGTDEQLTGRTQGLGSGGEQAKLAHLPLFAATAAYYRSASSTAPRLLMLDEAFAGIDDHQKADCMAMLVDLDLDVVLTNYAEFGCYPQVPALAIYHLERMPPALGVMALRFVWNGHERAEDDPHLAAALR